MNHDSYPDDYILGILRSIKSIAMVGASANEVRPSYFVLKYLHQRGYFMLPINPGLAGKTILGLPVHGRLADLPGPVDMIDIFRNSEAAGTIVDEVLSMPWQPRVIWMQLTVRNDAAAARAEEKGIRVVMNRCPKIEFGRLSGEIGWAGVNSRTLSSKRLKRDDRGFQKLGLRPQASPPRD
jgi:predicted CoA-binding protein